MPINLASYIIPKNGQSFFLIDDFYLKGGYHACADVAARDAIYGVTLKIGMLVYTAAENKYWQYTDVGVWTERHVGEIGPVGPTGEQGIQGIQGPVGPTGPAGIQGTKGATGSTGPVGPTGTAGTKGTTGTAGVQGPVGPTGAAGVGTNPSLLAQYRGAVIPSVGTAKYIPRTTITITKAALWVTGTASSTITVYVKKNGNIVQVLTLNAGQTINTVTTNFILMPSDYLTYDVVGGSGNNLTVRLDY